MRNHQVQTNHFETECSLKCTDNGKTMNADVVSIKEGESLTVMVGVGTRVARVHLKYTKFEEYVGSTAGLEFITKGPKFIGSTYR